MTAAASSVSGAAAAPPKLEIACFSAEDAILAWRGGADRIELCADHSVGGTTPPFEAFIRAKQAVNIPIFVMIRARGGDDFCYSEEEFSRMKTAIERFKGLGAQGFVLGVLSANRSVDVERTRVLVRLAHPLPCTFHRAIDHTLDLDMAMDDVVLTGCKAVLSSGGPLDAVAGIDVLARLARLASNANITLIVGGGVRAKNLLELKRRIHAHVFHSSGLCEGVTRPDLAEIRLMRTVLQDDTRSQD